MPASGWLGDRFGTKRISLTALAIFTAASALCGPAQSPEQLIAARVLQRAGGGLLTPVAMAMLYRAFPPKQRVAVGRILIFALILGPALGPVLGGFLVEQALDLPDQHPDRHLRADLRRDRPEGASRAGRGRVRRPRLRARRARLRTAEVRADGGAGPRLEPRGRLPARPVRRGAPRFRPDHLPRRSARRRRRRSSRGSIRELGRAAITARGACRCALHASSKYSASNSGLTMVPPNELVPDIVSTSVPHTQT
jgi:hypothetical protein